MPNTGDGHALTRPTRVPTTGLSRPEGSPDSGSQMIIVEDGVNRFEEPVRLAPGAFVFLIVNLRQSEGAPIAGQVYFETEGAVAGRFTAPIRSTDE